ncbi:hypothetical protein TeGR_g239, partial [Tetraparma gracilis]
EAVRPASPAGRATAELGADGPDFSPAHRYAAVPGGAGEAPPFALDPSLREDVRSANGEYFSLKRIDAYISQRPVFSRAQCADIIDEIDASVEEKGGFGSYVFAKKTLHCYDHPALKELVQTVSEGLRERAADLYGGAEFEWTKTEEPHVVSYETQEEAARLQREGGEEFASVPYHTDNAEVTFIAALSEPGEDF